MGLMDISFLPNILYMRPSRHTQIEAHTEIMQRNKEPADQKKKKNTMQKRQPQPSNNTEES